MKSIYTKLSITCLLAMISAHATARANGTPTVRISDGILAGRTVGVIDSFLGIPYAAPPIGPLRWQPPTPAESWADRRQAVNFGADCMQPLTPNGYGPWTSEYIISGPVSENCLFLNVWKPSAQKPKLLPVLFWIHGGGFTSGSGAIPIYDGANLSRKDVVVVTVNYRLGVLGFLADSKLATPGQPVGNYGILDMIAALKWVKANIAAFGGDPNRVTIAGQSAGSAAVHALLTSPKAKGLFVGAIAESGSGTGLNATPLAQAEATALDFEREVAASTADALRALPAARLVANLNMPTGSKVAVPQLRFGTTLDGATISSDPFAGSDVPVLTGLNGDEGSSMDPAYGQATRTTFAEHVHALYGDDGAAALKLYPNGTDSEAANSAISMSQDRGLSGLWMWNEERSKSHRSSVYGYIFLHPTPGPTSSRYRAFHSSEIPYVFGNLDKSKRPFTQIDYKLSALMSTYWVNFITKADPNGVGLPKWPTLSTVQPEILKIDTVVQAKPIMPSSHLEFFKMELKKGVTPTMF